MGTDRVTKRFWQDPYLSQLSTTISAIDGDQITVAETIFFAFSGGQESDRGVIAGRPVVRAEKQGRQIVYQLPSTDDLHPGDPIVMTIEWPRRYRLMRLHFAAELILELIYQSYPATGKSGAHISADKARIDFAWDGNISALFPALLAETSRIIAADLPITCGFSDVATERRYWKIDGFAQVPCGGTHCTCHQ